MEKNTAALTDELIERLALHHIAPGVRQLAAIGGEGFYRQTEQYARIKAFSLALLVACQGPAEDVEPYGTDDVRLMQANRSSPPLDLEAPCRDLIKYCDSHPPMGESLWFVQQIRAALASHPAPQAATGPFTKQNAIDDVRCWMGDNDVVLPNKAYKELIALVKFYMDRTTRQAPAEGVGSIGDDKEFRERLENYAFQSRMVYSPQAWKDLVSYIDSRAAPERAAIHSDDAAVDRFAAAMKAKMAASRAKGRGGWEDPEQCSADSLRTMMTTHITKGDPVDVGNFAMMLFNRGERTGEPVDDLEQRFLRAGRNLHAYAKALGWMDDGEGALEFVVRFVAFAHGAPSSEASAPAPDAEAIRSALKFAADTIELFDDATMQADYMLDAGECAGIIRALPESPYIRALSQPSPAVKSAEPLTPLDYRAQGREEALAIILAEDAEDPFSSCIGSSALGDSGDYTTEWDENKLRDMLHIADRKHDAYDRAEAAYWDAMGHKDEAKREMLMVEQAPFYKPLHDFLSKHEAWDLMGDLKRAAAVKSAEPDYRDLYEKCKREKAAAYERLAKYEDVKMVNSAEPTGGAA